MYMQEILGKFKEASTAPVKSYCGITSQTPADAHKATQATIETFGSLDKLINNPGILPFSPAQKISEELWDNVLYTNLKSVLFYSHAAVQEMIRVEKGGRIINIASMNSFPPGVRFCSIYLVVVQGQKIAINFIWLANAKP